MNTNYSYDSELQAAFRSELLDLLRHDLIVADVIRKYCIDILDAWGIPNKPEGRSE